MSSNCLECNALQVKSIAANNPNYFFTNKDKLESAMGLMRNIIFLDLSMCNIISEMAFLSGMPKLKHAVLDCLTILTTDG